MRDSIPQSLKLISTNFTIEILSSKFINFIISSFYPIYKAPICQFRQSPIYFISGFVNIYRDHRRREDEIRLIESLQYPIVNRHLHPPRRIASWGHLVHTLNASDLSRSNNLLIGIISWIRENSYIRGTLNHVVDRRGAPRGRRLREKSVGAPWPDTGAASVKRPKTNMTKHDARRQKPADFADQQPGVPDEPAGGHGERDTMHETPTDDDRPDARDEVNHSRRRQVDRYRTDDSRPSVSYGPATETNVWVLAITCQDSRVEVELDEESMYELWVEVRGVPWPDPELPGEESRREQDRLVRQLVHAANGADTEMLEDALEALGVRR